MQLHFIFSDYLLTWNLLYGPSFSESVHKFKQKLYLTYRRQYEQLQKDKEEMLTDIKNFIPDDDTLYNLVLETKLFLQLKEGVEKYRLELLKIWDQYKKKLRDSLKEILKFPLKEEYQIVVLHPVMNSCLTISKGNMIGWGKQINPKKQVQTIVEIMETITRMEMGKVNQNYQEIVDVVLELAFQNELYTRLSGKSNYQEGDSTLTYLKKQIYPYWLMYLGYDKEEFPGYMMRDGITFEMDSYVFDAEMKKKNLMEFIEFCVHNQKRIVHINTLEII